MSTTYAYTHAPSNSDNNYYRLSQFDIDGGAPTYNNMVINADCKKKKSVTLSSYPNPSKDNFTLSLENAKEGAVKLSMIDLKGTQIFENNLEVKDGFNLYLIDSFKVPGVYYIYLGFTDENVQVVKHIICE